MKLHLACGKIRLPGYINIDIQPSSTVDVVADIRDLPYKKNSVDEIYCCAALEHFGRNEVSSLLGHWHTILKPGGLLRLSTTDFEAVCEHYLNIHNLHELLGLLVGGQKDPYDFHKILFDFTSLQQQLQLQNFIDIKRYDWRETPLGELQIDDYSQAYLPHMDKEHGRLMMLNVEATKNDGDLK